MRIDGNDVGLLLVLGLLDGHSCGLHWRGGVGSNDLRERHHKCAGKEHRLDGICELSGAIDVVLVDT
jgi:hypothetical protein